jgi:hypothetical protein
MTFDLVRGSGNRFMTTVVLDERNTSACLWFCERRQEYHWQLIWEDGSSYGTHVASGAAPTREKARADIVQTMIWTEDTWPRLEYFDNNW